MKQATANQIRDFHGHNGAERRCRVKRCGEVWVMGSTELSDRGLDFWRFAGWRQQFRVDDDGYVVVIAA